MTCTGVGFFTILLITEYSIVSSFIYTIKSYFTSAFVRDESEPLHVDVVEEKNRVKAMTQTEIENHNLVLKEMSKAYGKFVAVHDMSIAVEQLVLCSYPINSILNIIFYLVLSASVYWGLTAQV